MHNLIFLITVDAEGDDPQQKHDSITAKNARYLPRFRQLCEKYDLKPVYLTNYEMVIDPFYIEFTRDMTARDTAEVGMHLRVWNSLSTGSLTADDWRHKPYLIEYSDAMIREKIDYMAHLPGDTFQTKMVSHRAGRWASDERYARLLVERGYQVDRSATPRVNWETVEGAPQGDDGIGYRRFPQHVYFLDENDINREGYSPLLEILTSIQYKRSAWMSSLKQGYNRLRGKVCSPSVYWLRPIGGNVEAMKEVAEQTLTQGSGYVEYMLHSPEYMPGGSLTFQDEWDIERLYADPEAFSN